MATSLVGSSFCFESARELFCQSIQTCVGNGSAQSLNEAFREAAGSDADKKTSLDQALRDELLSLVSKDVEPQVYMDLLNVAVEATQSDICSTATLFIMLSDLFDSISLDQCDKVFAFIEDRVSLWKLELFYNAGKNYLLRMCNDLLRRLSKSQNTVFCGRIQLFLARLFPLEEKSGLNLMSQFNVENVTLYCTKADEVDKMAFRTVSIDEKEPGMEIEDGEMDELSNIPVDYNLYRKFWSLQDFFRRPSQCYEKFAWKTFTNYSDEVLSCFSSYKLDDIKSQRKRKERQAMSSSQPYFAKYLTSEKLLDLQLSDCNFRRYVLVQYLILFQYLNAQVRFKTANQTLTEEQTTWVKEANDRVLSVLRETPPDGETFTATVKHILAREENWNTWKNDGCQSYIRRNEEARAKATPRPKKRSFGEDVMSSGAKVIKMGNAELTRLWNLCPDNMAACKSEKRNYLPSVEEFFETAIEQADPNGGIEDHYRVINNATYGWKGLRLLSRSSPHFFGPVASGSTSQYKTVPQYLELMVGKMIKELPTTPANDLRAVDNVEDNTSVTNGNGNVEDNIDNTKDDKEEESMGGDEGTSAAAEDDDEADAVDDDATTVAVSATENRVTVAILQTVASRLTDDWKALAAKLNFQDDIMYFENEEAASPVDRAFKMLSVWNENEGNNATVNVLQQVLGEVGQSTLAAELVAIKAEQT
jgi:THO complex subunit 1